VAGLEDPPLTAAGVHNLTFGCEFPLSFRTQILTGKSLPDLVLRAGP